MKRFSKIFALLTLVLTTTVAQAQIKFDSIALGQSYQTVMGFVDEEHSFKVEEVDTLVYHMVEFYDSTQKMLIALYFDRDRMVLERIHMEEPHHLKGRREHRLMAANMHIWAGELHVNEMMECYVEDNIYIEEILDAEADGVHTVRVQFPMEERKMIVDVYIDGREDDTRRIY